MTKIIMQQNPRFYEFIINNQKISCQTEYADEAGMIPIDILIKDLVHCVEQLKKIKELNVNNQNKEIQEGKHSNS